MNNVEYNSQDFINNKVNLYVNNDTYECMMYQDSEGDYYAMLDDKEIYLSHIKFKVNKE